MNQGMYGWSGAHPSGTGAAGPPGANFTVGGIPAVHCSNSGNIAVPNNTDTKLTLDTNEFDQGTATAQHSTSVNTTRLTCQQAGVYLVTACVYFAVNSTGFREIWITLNGGSTEISDVLLNAAGSSQPTILNLAHTYKLALADYIELHAYHNAGVTLNVVAAASYTPTFGMVLVA